MSSIARDAELDIIMIHATDRLLPDDTDAIGTAVDRAADRADVDLTRDERDELIEAIRPDGEDR